MTNDLLNDNQNNGSSEEIIDNGGNPSQEEEVVTPAEEVTISKEELEALKIKAEKFDKKEGDFEKAFKKEREKNKATPKAPEFDEDEIIAKAVKQIEEKNFFTSKGILNPEDQESLKKDAAILGVSLEEAFNNEVVRSKLEKVAKDRATKAAEDDISLNSVFSSAEFMSDDAFRQAMRSGQLPKTKENLQRLNKIDGLVL